MATILKKVGLKVVEFNVETDELVAGTLKLGGELGTAYTEAELSAIATNTTLAQAGVDDAAAAQSSADAATITADQAALDVVTAQGTADAATITADQAALDVVTAQGTADAATITADQAALDVIIAQDDATAALGLAAAAQADAGLAQDAATLALSDSATNTASIDALASVATYGEAASAISATDAPLEGGTIDLANSGLSDDETPFLVAADLPEGSLIIFDGDTAPVVGKVESVLGEVLTITYIGVTALVIDKLYHVKYNLLASPGSEEVRTIYAMEAIDAAMVKVADEIWDSASGIGLGSFTSTTGAIDASDTVLSAIQKLDGNITASAPDLSGLVSKGGDEDAADLVVGTVDAFDVVLKRENVAQVTLSSTGTQFRHDGVLKMDVGQYYTSMYSSGVKTAEFTYSSSGADKYFTIFGFTGMGVYLTADAASNMLLDTRDSGAAASGFVRLETGTSSLDTGVVDIITGNSIDGNSGAIVLQTGSSTNGERGNVEVRSDFGYFDSLGTVHGGMWCQESGEIGVHHASAVDMYLESTDAIEMGNTDSGNINIRTGAANGGDKGTINHDASEHHFTDSAQPTQLTASIKTYEYIDGSGLYGCFFNGDVKGDLTVFQSCPPSVTDAERTADVEFRSGLALANNLNTESNNSGDVYINSGKSIWGDTGNVTISAGECAGTGTTGTKGQVIIKDAIDPVDPQDVVTKAYLEANGADLSTVVTKGGDTDGAALVLGTADDYKVSVLVNSVEALAIQTSSFSGNQLLSHNYNAGGMWVSPKIGDNTNPFHVSSSEINLSNLDAVTNTTENIGYIYTSADGIGINTLPNKGVSISTGGTNTATKDISISTGTPTIGDTNSGNVIISSGDASGAGVKGQVIIKDAIDPVDPQDVVTLAYLEENTGGSTSMITTGSTAIEENSIVALGGLGVAQPARADGLTSREDLEMLFLSPDAVAGYTLGEFVIARTDVVLAGDPINEVTELNLGYAEDFGDSTNYSGGFIDIYNAAGRHHLWFSDAYTSTAPNPSGAASVHEVAYVGGNGNGIAANIAALVIAGFTFEDNVANAAVGVNSIRITETSATNVTDVMYSVAPISIGIHTNGGAAAAGNPGDYMYLSDTIPGRITSVKPTDVGTDVVLIGRFSSEGLFHFSPKYLMTN